MTAHMLSGFMRVVVDTNILVAAVMSKDGGARQIVRHCMLGQVTPLVGNALFCEYEDVFARDALFDTRLVNQEERASLLNAFMACCIWIPVYFLWRPNLKDEADNHLLELAVAGNAGAIVTVNKRDFADTQLRFPEIEILNPEQFLRKGLN